MKAKMQNFCLLTLTLPNPTTELPARNAKAAWGLMQSNRKPTTVSQITLKLQM
jgi:hypothetical protein